MKRTTKKFLSIILVAIILVAQFSFLTNVSMAATTVQDLRNKFPNGAYWNGGNEDGYTWTPCYHNESGIGTVCNECDNAWQCLGFAFKLYKDYYGQSARAAYTHQDINSIKPGDVLTYYSYELYSYTYGHTVWVTGVDGDTLYIADCNWNNNCNIRWDATLSKSSIVETRTIYSAPYEINDFVDTEAPNISNVTVSEKNKEGFTITADVSDNVEVTKVSFYVTIDGQEKVFNAPSISGGKASVRINYSDYGLTSGASKATANIWAYDAAGLTSNTGTAELDIDLDDPMITDVKVTNITGEGYNLTFKVSDNVGVAKVQCPTWNSSKDEDGIPSDWETNSKYTAIEKAGTYTYHVNIDNGGGEYVTQISAFDEYGNVTTYNVEVDVYPITDVTLNENELELYKGQEFVLEAEYEPINTTGDTEVTWSSSDEEVATVEDGIVTALKEGTTTITATIDGVSETCEVTVKEIPLESIAIEEQNVQLKINEEKQLTILYNPEDTTDDKTAVWSSSDESVVKVSEDGKITGLKVGTATITVTVGNKTATTEVTVNQEVLEGSIAGEGTNASGLPKTADVQVPLLVAGMIISLAGIAFVIKRNKK